MLQMKLVSGFYQGPIKALQATGAVWWSRWGSRCWPVKFFCFFLQLGLKLKPPCFCGLVSAVGRFAGSWCRWRSARITHSHIRLDRKQAQRLFFFLLFSPPAVILKTDVFAHIWCFVMINNNMLWFSWFALNRAGFIGSRSQPEGCDYRKVHPNLLHFCLDCLHLVLILEVMSRPWNSWRPSVALILLEHELKHVLLNKKHLKFFKTRSLT